VNKSRVVFHTVRYWAISIKPIWDITKPYNVSSWWAMIVLTYCLRKFSDEADKLHALAGVARIYAVDMADGYLAGLWRKSIDEGLLWIKRKDDDGHRPKRWRRPSWSWMAIDGMVDWYCRSSKNHEKDKALSEIRSCSVTGENTFSELEDGLLEIYGLLMEHQLDPETCLLHFWDISSDARETLPRAISIFDTADDVNFVRNERAERGRFSAFCLPMNSWEDTMDEKNSRRCANGLLLAKCAESTVRRIGLFQSADVSVELFDRQTRLRELFMVLPDQSEDTLPQLADRRTWLQAYEKEPPIHQGIFCKGVQCLALKRQMHIRGSRHTWAYCKAELCEACKRDTANRICQSPANQCDTSSGYSDGYHTLIVSDLPVDNDINKVMLDLELHKQSTLRFRVVATDETLLWGRKPLKRLVKIV
jgi:hypothetical protein